jgi:hypothetical protein
VGGHGDFGAGVGQGGASGLPATATGPAWSRLLA